MKRSFWGLVILFTVLFAALLKADPLKEMPDYEPDASAARHDVPADFYWNLTPLAADDGQWEEQMDESRQALKNLSALHNELNTARGLLNYLKAYFSLEDKVNRLTLYASLSRDSETSDPVKIDRHEQGLALTEAVMQEGGILRETLFNLSDQDWEQALKEKPGLSVYQPYIISLRRRGVRMLSPSEEALLAMAGDNMWAQIDLNELPSPSEKAFRAMISDLKLPVIQDREGQNVQMTFSNYPRFRASADRSIRKTAVAGMFKTLKNYENTFAALLGEQARFSYFLAKARGYDSVLEAYLDRDQLTPDVYLNLIETVRSNTGPLHNYVSLRKKALGYDRIHLYDLYIPMVEQAAVNLTYKQGAEVILKALKPLGPAYLNTLTLGMDPANGWIDVYPSNDKNSGAFSASTYGVHPYVKMNYQNRFNDVSTLAHEYGHAMHSHYAMTHQPYLSWRYVPFLAEIASTCNEALLSKYMIDHAITEKERIWLLSELLETIRTTIYRQTLFAEFELRLHELVEQGESVNADKLNAIYVDLLKTYYGPDYTIDSYDGIEWAYIPHFYYKYYVFTYATGLASGIAFAEKMTEEGLPARDAYLNLLKGGCSEPPLMMLKKAGVDLTRPMAIEAALKLFERTLDELNALLNQ